MTLCRRTALVLTWLCLPALGCLERAPEKPPNVVLVTVDTLRADRLGCYGAAPRTPEIDRLASQGALFTNAASPMPSTRPSHFSILTSLHPRAHGVTSNALSLPEEIVTLPEIFSAAGYRTAGFTGVKILAPGSGAERGFAVFDAPPTGRRTAEDVVTRAESWLGSAGDGEPFFLWLHVYDPHIPYAPPAGFAVEPPTGFPANFSYQSVRPALEHTEGDVPQELLDYALAMYHGEVEYVDQQLGRLLRALADRQLLDETVVVFTADHGECFENGIYFEHGGCLFDGAVRVPLILRYPLAVAASQRLSRQVELLDVAPTLLELAGLEVPESFAGTSLLAERRRGGAAFLQHPVYLERAVQARMERRSYLRSVTGELLKTVETAEKVALRTPSWKYILTGGEEELYDLENDPVERRNLAGERLEIVERLRPLLERWVRENPLERRAADELDEELERTLRSLGYL